MNTLIQLLGKRIVLSTPPNQYSLQARLTSSIFALSSGQGRCAVAVIRVSGTKAEEALLKVTNTKTLPTPRLATLKRIINPETGVVIDRGIIIWFPGPKSYTGEDSFEMQVHGGPASIKSILDVLGKLPGLRMAEPGEFTKRAFFNGKLDLTEVEGLSDLLNAETEIQRKQAFLQSEGSLKNLFKKWQDILVGSIAKMETYIEFSESENIAESDLMKEVLATIVELRDHITGHLNDSKRADLIRKGVETIIIGAPNVGKSSIMNILCLKPLSLVTPIAGTTRDVMEYAIDLNGYPMVLKDTAGLRTDATDEIEILGINRAIENYRSANLIILVVAADAFSIWLNENPNKDLLRYMKEYISLMPIVNEVNMNAKRIEDLFRRPCVVVINKIDLLPANFSFNRGIVDMCHPIEISCSHNSGMPWLVQSLAMHLKLLCDEPSEEHPYVSQERHRQLLDRCCQHLGFFISQNLGIEDAAISANELRLALICFATLAGERTHEDVLDIIFKDFCIGK